MATTKTPAKATEAKATEAKATTDEPPVRTARLCGCRGVPAKRTSRAPGGDRGADREARDGHPDDRHDGAQLDRSGRAVLPNRVVREGRVGFEPTTRGLKVPCSNR